MTEDPRCREWQAAHEAKSKAQWAEQWRRNLRRDNEHMDLKARLTSMERRMLILSALGAVVGGLLGVKIPGLF